MGSANLFGWTNILKGGGGQKSGAFGGRPERAPISLSPQKSEIFFDSVKQFRKKGEK